MVLLMFFKVVQTNPMSDQQSACVFWHSYEKSVKIKNLVKGSNYFRSPNQLKSMRWKCNKISVIQCNIALIDLVDSFCKNDAKKLQFFLKKDVSLPGIWGVLNSTTSVEKKSWSAESRDTLAKLGTQLKACVFARNSKVFRI